MSEAVARPVAAFVRWPGAGRSSDLIASTHLGRVQKVHDVPQYIPASSRMRVHRSVLYTQSSRSRQDNGLSSSVPSFKDQGRYSTRGGAADEWPGRPTPLLVPPQVLALGYCGEPLLETPCRSE